MESKKYNGWKNYETWNVALWLQNDESMHDLCFYCKDYRELVLKLHKKGIAQTPDDVYYADAYLDMDALDRVVRDIAIAGQPF
jgi:hypothetical protein